MTNLSQYRGWILGERLRAASTALALAIVFVLEVVAAQSAQAQTYSVLHTFTGGKDGGNSTADLVRDAQGNFYGTTSKGGASNVSSVCDGDPRADSSLRLGLRRMGMSGSASVQRVAPEESTPCKGVPVGNANMTGVKRGSDSSS
jgi:hypothetical protein